MHFANCATLAAVLFATLTQNLRLCSFAAAGIVLKILSKNEGSYKKSVINNSDSEIKGQQFLV